MPALITVKALITKLATYRLQGSNMPKNSLCSTCECIPPTRPIKLSIKVAKDEDNLNLFLKVNVETAINANGKK